MNHGKIQQKGWLALAFCVMWLHTDMVVLVLRPTDFLVCQSTFRKTHLCEKKLSLAFYLLQKSLNYLSCNEHYVVTKWAQALHTLSCLYCNQTLTYPQLTAVLWLESIL